MYSIVLSGSLDEKQKHQFIKLWKSIPKNSFKHLTLFSYSDAKQTLATIPVTLAWDLQRHHANEIIQKLSSDFPVEIQLQGGIPSSFAAASKVSEVPVRNQWFGRLSLVLCLVSMGAGVYFLWERLHNPSSSTREAQSGGSEVSRDLQSQSRNFPELPRFEVPQIPESNQEQQAPDTRPHEFDRHQMNTLLDSTVFIRDSSKLGSGFLITADGYLLSNAHVTSDMVEPFVILRNGQGYVAQKIREDKHLDVALLKIPVNGASYLRLGDANQLYPGQNVLTIGNPGGLSFTVTRGIVSYVGRIIHEVPFIQTDAAINRGNSGGPMINEKMEVVGINSLTSLGEQGISFALPINFVCDPNGVALGIGVDSCQAFQGDKDPLLSASAENSQPHSSNSRGLPANHYQDEADDLKSVFTKEVRDLEKESERIKSQIASVQKQMDEDPNSLSLRERLNPQVDELTHQFKEIPKRKAESQKRYLEQLISLLERQKADPNYTALGPKIEAQIADITRSRKQLDDYLK